MIEPCASTAKAFHVVMTRDADGYQAFYSGHDTQTDADQLACIMNARAKNKDDKEVPAGFTYSVKTKPTK